MGDWPGCSKKDFANLYVSAGCGVLPATMFSPSGEAWGKGCRIKGWKEKNLVARTKEDVEKLWGIDPTANICVLTGERFDVIDIDSEETFDILKDKLEPLFSSGTPIVKTLRGWHIYVKPTGLHGCTNLFNNNPEGVDLLAQSKWCTGVGSERTTDKDTSGVYDVLWVYKTISRHGLNFDYLAPCPDWILEAYQKKEAAKNQRPQIAQTNLPWRPADEGEVSRYVTRAVEGMLGDIENAQHHQRNEVLNKKTFKLAQLIQMGTIGEGVLQEACVCAQRAGLPEQEVNSTIASAVAGARKHPLTRGELEDIVAAARKLPEKRIAPKLPQQNLGAMIPQKETTDLMSDMVSENTLGLKQSGQSSSWTYVGCLSNVVKILEGDPRWKGCLGFNEFTEEVQILKPLPFDSFKRNDREWKNSDTSLFVQWLEDEWDMSPRFELFAAVQAVACQHRFNPVVDYLESLVWDGCQRLEGLALKVFGAVEHYESMAIKKWMISAVARAYEPGCKVDSIIILEGPQGRRKSTALRLLAGEEYFDDRGLNLDNTADSGLKIQKSWIFEFAEIGDLSKKDAATTKAFLSAREDKYRAPYGRVIETHKRHTVFAGTTNSTEYLKDETGGRRYWPIRCCVNRDTIDTETLLQHRDQLWAEAVKEYKQGTLWWFDSKETDFQPLEDAQAERLEEGSWDDAINDYVREKFKSFEYSGAIERFFEVGIPARLDDLFKQLGFENLANVTNTHRNKIKRALESLGFEKKRATAPDGSKPYKFFISPRRFSQSFPEWSEKIKTMLNKG